ncbi:hypothetical protein DCW30_29155 [Streptomyces alfalfae]|uniref:Uncharacterized protein n=1 Tax=Streptomyces alfalfae TaxID=1642299 RepID=A0A1P8TGP8_9ACTN|nr:hypothetical protein [Streptomyces alfalfae]AYA17187.1 hypothetical protein D3X13_13885 [Streptomyces fradiae]APY86800.1 hypothetical protein A7J05_14630 [Streptomyces alfalfae]QQC90946.1 hypothetical protein I8755_22935 [Streptomyces alfalfae]QUI33432.1 hypothetical protein H9W91_23125 [Streptomyces alfalfae]RXX37911.1 hypothetical protein DCW30_29155 [Streptomyces alfalfae]
MLRHESHPGKLVAGLCILAVAVVYAGDATGAWEAPWFVALPMVMAGLLLAGVTAAIHGIRPRGATRPGGRPRPGRESRD